MSTNAVNMSTTSLPMDNPAAAARRVEKATAPRAAPPKTHRSLECRKADDVAPWLANIELHRTVERLVARLDAWRVLDARFNGVEIGDARHGDEERRAMTGQLGSLSRAVGDDAGSCLIHDLDTIFFHAGENHLTVGTGHFILLGERKSIDPEIEAWLDRIDDEDW